MPATVQKELVPLHNIERLFLYCNLQSQSIPIKLSIQVIYNQGLSAAQVENTIVYSTQAALSINPEGLFKQLQIQQQVVQLSQQAGILVDSVLYIPIESSNLIQIVECIFNDTQVTLGVFNYTNQDFNCSLPSTYQAQQSLQTYILQVRLNKNYTSQNTAIVYLFNNGQMLVSIRYQVILSNMMQAQFENMVTLSQSDIIYLEYCIVSIQLSGQIIEQITEFDRTKLECLQPLLQQFTITQALKDFNQLSKLTIQRNQTLLKIVSNNQAPIQKTQYTYSIPSNPILSTNTIKPQKAQQYNTSNNSSRQLFSDYINSILYPSIKVNISALMIVDNGRAYQVQFQSQFNSDLLVQCAYTGNANLSYFQHSYICVFQSSYMLTQDYGTYLQLVVNGEQISNAIPIPILQVNKAFFVGKGTLLFLQDDSLTIRLVINSSQLKLVSSLQKEQISIVISFDEINDLKISCILQQIIVQNQVELASTVQQSALDLQFKIGNEFVYLLLTQFSDISQLHINVRVLVNSMIVKSGTNKILYFDSPLISGQMLYIRPSVQSIVMNEKTNVTILSLSRSIPESLKPSVQVQIQTGSSQFYLYQQQFSIQESRIYIPNIEAILFGLAAFPLKVYINIYYESQVYALNRGSLILNDHSIINPFKYNQTINTTFIEQPIINIQKSNQQNVVSPHEPLFSINANNSNQQIIPEKNKSLHLFSQSSYKVRNYTEPYINFTDLLLKDNLETYPEFNFQQVISNASVYSETQALKKINVSLINTSFVSLKDKEQVILTFNKPKRSSNQNTQFYNQDEIIQVSPPTEYNLSTQCIVYRINSSNQNDQPLNQTLWAMLLNLPKIQVQSGQQLLNSVVFDDSSNDYVQVSFIYEGKLSITKNEYITPEPSLILNESMWYRNTTIDYIATADYYTKQENNSLIEIQANSSSIISDQFLIQIDEFLNYYTDYQQYLQETKDFKSPQPSIFSNFQLYSQLYGRFRSLEGVSYQAMYFESSPTTGVYGNFAKFLNSQKLSAQNLSISKVKGKDSTNIFAQQYLDLNFSSNASAQPSFECPPGNIIVQSTTGQSSCQAKTPTEKFQTNFINLTEQGSYQSQKGISQPLKIESPFFKSNPYITSNQKIIVSGKRETILLQSKESYMNYDDFQSINMSCRFYNTTNLQVVAYETPCYFASPNLNVIQVEVKQYKLMQGTYQMQFVLNNQNKQMVSEITQQYFFEVVLNPQIFSVYPPYYIFLNTVINQSIYLHGRMYKNLISLESRLFCKLKFQGSANTIQLKPLYLNAIIVSDSLINCTFNAQILKNKAITNFITAPLVQFQVGLTIDRKEIYLNKQQGDPNFLMINSVPPINIKYTDPNSIAVTTGPQNNELNVYVTRSGILKETSNQQASVEFMCQFYQANVFMAETMVIFIDVEYSPVTSRIVCDMPSIQSTFESGVAKIAIVLKRSPTIAGVPFMEMQLSQNFYSLNLMRIPTITNVFPPSIYNVAAIRQVAVIGRDFINNENLYCQFNQVTNTKATFVSSNKAICSLIGLDMSVVDHITVAITNDRANTLSNQATVAIIKNLPQFKILLNPTVFQANNQYDIQVQGIYLDQAEYISLKIQQGSYEQYTYCNVSVQITTIANCFGLYFPAPGVYQTQMVLGMDRSQQTKGLLKLTVGPFQNQGYFYPVSLPPTPQQSQQLQMTTPPTIQSVSLQIVTVNSVIIIKGINFDPNQQYTCSFSDSTNYNLQFTNAIFISASQLQWAFTINQFTGIMGCGVIILRDSYGHQYQAVGQTNILKSALCYILGLKVGSLSTTGFPYNFKTKGVYTNLTIDAYQYSLLRTNQFLTQQINSITLQFEGVRNQTCSLIQQNGLITCGVAFNNNTALTEVRMWLIINNDLQFALDILFSYYGYLNITSTNPNTTLIHMTTKKISVSSNNLINTNTLACILLGDIQGPMIIPAIYRSTSSIDCPLTPAVFENNQVALQITNNYTLFSQVNSSYSWVNFTIQSALNNSVNLNTVNNQQTLNITQIQANLSATYAQKLQNDFNTLKGQVQGTQIVQISTPKVMTGPWITQFALVVYNLTSGLQSLRCVLVYQLNPQQIYTVSSDTININSAQNLITCYFQKEIVMQATYCVELSISTPYSSFQTSTCQAQLEVFHIPTLTAITSYQNSSNQYHIDTEMVGFYLQNWQTQWLCFFYIFEDKIDTPIKIQYSSLPETFLTPDNKHIQCRFTEILYFFSTFRKYETQGMTNIQDFFYTNIIKFQNNVISPVFLYSHLVCVVDPVKFSLSQTPDTQLQQSLMSQQIDIINNPGDTIGIAGFFINNTLLQIQAVLTNLDDIQTEYLTQECIKVSNNFITCQIPSVISEYGYYMISLVEAGTLYRLNDENIITIMILPLPTIISTTVTTYVSSNTDDIYFGQQNSQQYITHFKVKLDDAFNGDYLDKYKQKYLQQTSCRVGGGLVTIQANSTWASSNEIQCTLVNFYDYKPECIEISINNGNTYSTDCMSIIQSIRAPLAYSINPTQTMLRQQLIINISGKDFINGEIYKCLFHPSTTSTDFLATGYFDNLVTAIFISSSLLRCNAPLSVQNVTNSVFVSLYTRGMKIKTFPQQITYLDYLRILSLSPIRGTVLGGTPITLQVENLPMPSLSYKPYCRFSLDFLQKGQYFTSELIALNTTTATCLTPDISSAFNNYLDTYMDSYVTINDIDGVFRPENSYLFTYIPDYGLIQTVPNSTYMMQRQSIQLKGYNFLNVYSLLVKLVLTGSQQVIYFQQHLIYVDESTLVIQMPSVENWQFQYNRNATFYISMNGGVDWSPQSADFIFYEEPQMTRLSMTQASMKGNVTVIIYGINFRQDITFCLFNEQQVVPTYVTSTQVACLTTPEPFPIQVRIKLMISDNYIVDTSILYFLFENFIQINSMKPTEGFVGGGNNITVFGNFSYFYNQNYTLQLGISNISQSNILSSQPYSITFIAPDLIPNYVMTVSKTNATTNINTVTTTTASTVLYNNQSASVTTTINSVFTNLLSDVITTSTVTTTLLQQSEIDQIYIYYQGVNYTNETVLYTYKFYATFNQIFPVSGPTNGGSFIQVWGYNFDDETYCYIDGTLILPVRVNSTFMVCETYPHKAGQYSFELAFNNITYVTTTGQQYTFYNDIQINTISPNYVSIYAGINQVKVDIYGLGFINSPDLQVRVDEQIITQVMWLSPKHIQFTTVNVLQEGPYLVYVSNNRYDFQRGSTIKVLNYYKLLGVTETSPTQVQIGPPSIVITVFGYNFPTSVPFYCVFNYTTPAQINSGFQFNVLANVISDTQLECNAATFIYQPTITSIPFTVSYNLQEYYGMIQLPYYPAVTLLDFNEKLFIQSMSTLDIELIGTNFINLEAEATCLIQNYLGVQQKAFNIYFVDTQHQICSFEMPNIGYYYVLVSNNGVQYAQSTVTLQVINSIQLQSVQPKIILSQNLNQMIFVQANNLISGSQCEFEIMTSQNQIVNTTRDFTLGKVINSNLMLCYVPNYSQLGTAIINLRVTYGSYLKAQSETSVILTVVDKCPAGYACKNYRIMPCPKGHYCPGGGLQQAAHICPIGYYQDKVQTLKCKPCPKGYMCPFIGMESPIPCPPGEVCSNEKLNSPNLQCPEGSYCFQGTQTIDINEFGLVDTLTQKCTIGSYCKPGMKTGVVVFNSNTSTPAPCKRGMVCYEGANDGAGIGPCPAGYFCPRPQFTGIPCPPRHYCPNRGNTYPIKCPRGTFNYNFGQKNCTICTLGRICPVEGLSMPLFCPPGYVCNKEGLVYPEGLCRVGHICLGAVATGTDSKKRSCFIAATATDCPYGIFFQNSAENQFTAQQFPNYFQGSSVCCMNGSDVQNYLINLGNQINNEDVFLSYGYLMNSTGQYLSTTWHWLWNGMRIIDKVAYGIGFNASDQFPVPIRKHREIILTYFYSMYTTYMQMLCPGSFLCLEGVNTLDTGDGLISRKFVCPTGSFCQAGSDSVIGSGLCPIGFYCPIGTQNPIQAPPGMYTATPGAVAPATCQPGTYADQYESTSCKQCPNGYQCTKKATIEPTICPLGMYRSIVLSNVCLVCPSGTFSFERGAKDLLECLECPPGRICDTVQIWNASQTIACTDGQVCPPGTGMRTQWNCPEGFYCPSNTADTGQFDYICDRGFFCVAGTGLSTKNRDTCPQTYYCPPGTGNVVVLGNTSDYTTYAVDTIYTRCPEGTGDDGQDTKNQIQQCGIDTSYTLLTYGLNIRPQAVKSTTQTSASASTTSTSTSSSSGGSRLLQSVHTENTSMNTRRWLRSRNLQSQAQLQIDQQMLTSLYEINYALGDYIDLYLLVSQPPTSDISPIQSSINLNRQYIARWCPLNMSLVSNYIDIELLSEDALQTNIPNVIFALPTSAYALVTFDIRHLQSEDFTWTYGEDYAISFTVQPDLTIDDPSFPVPMPEQFLSNLTARNDVLEFSIFAQNDMILRVDVLLYNALFLNYRHLFVNTTSVEIRIPNRAIYGTSQVFILSIQYADQLALPMNIPKLMSDTVSMPSSLVSFSYSRSDWNPLIQQSVKNRNIWVPSSLYWGTRSIINFNFMPYFSNCQGFGKWIPFWALEEQAQQCTLIPYADTIWMTDYSFGKKPTADNCNSVSTQCIYDEDIFATQPLSRWFEVLTTNVIFHMTVQPFSFQDVLDQTFDSTQQLDVFPVFDGNEAGNVPSSVTLSLSYYQYSQAGKQIVLADLTYDSFQIQTPAQQNMSQSTYYNFTFNFLPLSQEDLCISFALTSTFYTVLYVISGSISIAMILAFVMYHKWVGRPPTGQKKFLSFKFWSYLSLTYSPAYYGTVLSLVPLSIANIFVSIIISGHFMSSQTPLFSCAEGTPASSCVSTLFDMIMDQPNDVNIDYSVLRTGRTGTAFLVVGAYLVAVSLIILVPDRTDPDKIQEAYDGNIWEFYAWKRSNIVFTGVFLIFFMLAVIWFSFSGLYQNNSWAMIGVMQVLNFAAETAMDKQISEALMLAPLQVSFSVVIGLTGFGAPNFLVFLQGYFIGLGISMFTHNYIDLVILALQGAVEDSVPKIKRAFIKWISVKDDADEAADQANKEEEHDKDDANNDDDGAKKKEEEKKQVENEDDDDEVSSGAEIFYTDPSSVEDNVLGLSLDDDPNMMLMQRNMGFEDAPSIDVSMEMVNKKKQEKELKRKRQKDLERHLRGRGDDDGDEEKEQAFKEWDKQNEEGNNDDDIQLNDVEIQEVEPLIDYYGGYCNDTLSLIYQPFFTGLIWIFYYETGVAPQYGIAIQDFIFYFMFSVVIIPFQMVTDILFQNLQEWFHGLPAHDYADYMAFKFKKRKILWKNDEQLPSTVEETLRSLDQMAFSSQFFFIICLSSSGFNQVALGVQILVTQAGNNFNMFADNATIPLVVFMLAFCVITHKILIQLGLLMGIWAVQAPIEKQEAAKEETDIGTLFRKVIDPRQFNMHGNKDTPYEVKFSTAKWLNADRVKTEEDHNRLDLQTDRLVAETYRAMFMKHNKPWLQDQLYEVFTPRTLFLHRDEILNQFRKVMGPLDPDLSEDKDAQDSQEDIIGDDDSIIDETKKKKINPKQDELDWVRNNNSPITRAIVKFWIIRSRLRQRTSMQVQQLLDLMRKGYCLYCRTVYGLKVELVNNIEDLFYAFLKYQKCDLVNYKIVNWQRYFAKHASTRTICQDCQREIEIYHMKLKKHMREMDRRARGIHDHVSEVDEDGDDEIHDEIATIEGRKHKTRLISIEARHIILLYLKSARMRVEHRKLRVQDN